MQEKQKESKSKGKVVLNKEKTLENKKRSSSKKEQGMCQAKTYV